IPVNTTLLASRLDAGEGGLGAGAGGVPGAGELDAQVLTEPLDRDQAAPPQPVHGGGSRPLEPRTAVGAAEQRRRQVDDVAIDQSRGVEVVSHLRSPLDEDLEDLA